MSRTFTQRTEFRFLFLALAFVLALAALVAFPAGEASAVEDPDPNWRSWEFYLSDGNQTVLWTGNTQVLGYSGDDVVNIPVTSDAGWTGGGEFGNRVLHISCSVTFADGYAISDKHWPLIGDGWQVLSYKIWHKALPNGETPPECSQVFEGPNSGTVIVEKSVTGDSQQEITSFDFSITAYSNFALNAGNSWTSQAYSFESGTQVTVAELTQLSDDWTTSVSCNDGAQFSGGSSTTVTVVGDTTITCVFVNDYDEPEGPPDLTVRKVVKINGQEVDRAEDWCVWADTLSESTEAAEAGCTKAFLSGLGSASTEVTVGSSFELGEFKDSGDYSGLIFGGTTWNCVGGSKYEQGENTYVMVNEVDVTCTVTNSYSTPTPPTPPPAVVITVETPTTTTVAPCEVLGLEHLAAGDEDCEEAVLPLIIEETLPETGADTDAVAMVAGLMLLMGGALVAGSHYRRGESFTVDRLN